MLLGLTYRKVFVLLGLTYRKVVGYKVAPSQSYCRTVCPTSPTVQMPLSLFNPCNGLPHHFTLWHFDGIILALVLIVTTQ